VERSEGREISVAAKGNSILLGIGALSLYSVVGRIFMQRIVHGGKQRWMRNNKENKKAMTKGGGERGRELVAGESEGESEGERWRGWEEDIEGEWERGTGHGAASRRPPEPRSRLGSR
jgi:hypothetical protein